MQSQQQLLVSAVLAIAVLCQGFGYIEGHAQGSEDYATHTRHSDSFADSMEDQEDGLSDADDTLESAQSFYPSFAGFQNPPLGHSRPFLFKQEGAYSQKSNGDFNSNFNFDQPPRFSGYKSQDAPKAKSDVATHNDILGSGNFGVIKGGTFYAEGGGGAAKYESKFNPYYQNGHGRPSFYYGGGNPKPKQEQFANFRDFADINAPANPAYSEFVVVYANKNDTEKENSRKVQHKPKNIIESLALLDMESPTSASTEAPQKKLSASKRKLAALPPEKKHLIKKKSEQSSSDLTEPLLAVF